jgi:hypothetical protein
VLAVPVAAVLACAGLSACRTNVGVAARVDGKTITESKVASYVTDKAQPVKVQSATGATQEVGPLTFVVQTIVSEKYYAKILAATPVGLSPAAVAAEREQDLHGSSPEQVAAQAGLAGYTKKFQELWLYSRLLYVMISRQVQNGYQIGPVLAKVKFHVTINPRYGAWNERDHYFDAAPTAGLPAALQPIAARSGVTATP